MKRHSYQQEHQDLVVSMDTHKNPNLETTGNHHRRQRSAPSTTSSGQVFKRTHEEFFIKNTKESSSSSDDDDGEYEVIGKASMAAGEVERITAPAPAPVKMVEESGRERLKRHRVEMSGRVWVPDMWGQEDLLKNWIDCTVFDSSLGNSGIMSAREALIQEGRSTLRIENSC